MRAAGFPCRFAGCDRVFPVLDQRSMDVLRAASAARSAHEVADHDYHHVSPAPVTPPPPYFRPKSKSGARPEAARREEKPS